MLLISLEKFFKRCFILIPHSVVEYLNKTCNHACKQSIPVTFQCGHRLNQFYFGITSYDNIENDEFEERVISDFRKYELRIQLKRLNFLACLNFLSDLLHVKC